jgi:hypothetical protein
MNETIPIDDLVKPGEECRCEFQPYDKPDPLGESVDYKRKCRNCGHVWWGLHCPHDGYQNPCSKCKTRPATVPEGPPR